MFRRVFIFAALLTGIVFLTSTGMWADSEEGEAAAEPPKEEEKDGKAEKRKAHINVSPVRAKISPTIELSFPSGNLYEHFEQQFNLLNMFFNLDYNFFDNSLKADVSFAYPLGRFTPSLSFSDQLDFENYITPQLTGTKVTLAPTDKYISRTRSLDLNLNYNIFRSLNLTDSFILSDVFRGSLKSGAILDEGLNLTEEVGIIYNSVRVRESERKIAFEGAYFSSLYDFTFRDRFDNILSIDTKNSLLFHSRFGNAWSLETRMSANSPIKVYDKEKASFNSLGGFDTIRGYSQGSLHAFRFLLLHTNWEKEVLKEKEVKFRIFRLNAVMHQFKLLFLLDGLLTQTELDIASPVEFHSSLGTGISFLITGKKENKHFHLSFYVAQPLEGGYYPVFYFKSSLFSFEKKA